MPARPAPACRLSVERLDDRLVPSASLDSGLLTNYVTLANQPPGSTLVRDFACDMAVNANGDRYLLSLAVNADASVRNYAVTRLSAADQSVAWVTTFSDPGYDGGGALAVAPDGSVYAALRRQVGTASGPADILKIDPGTGQPVPGQMYQETRATADASGDAGTIDLAADAAGAVYYTYPGHTVKLQSQAGGLARVDDYAVGGAALAVSPDGGRVYVTGRFSGTLDCDPTRSYADNRDTLTTKTSKSSQDYDAFLLDLTRDTATGRLGFTWAGKVGSGGGWDRSDDVIFDDTGVYLLGYYAGGTSTTPIDFDPGAGTYALPYYSGGQYLTGNMFLLKLDPAHQFQWANGLGGTVGTSAYGDSYGSRGRLALDGAGGVYVGDVFNGSAADFDIEHAYPGDIDRPAGGGSSTFDQNLFVAKYGTANGVFRWVATGTTVGDYGAGAAGLDVSGADVTAFAQVKGTMTVNPGGAQFTADDGRDLFLGTFTQTADPVMVYVKNVDKVEGRSGAVLFTFEVLLSDPVAYPVTLSFQTANGTAAAGSDYTAASGTITFAPGETRKTVSVSVSGDRLREADETFFIDFASLTPGIDGAVRGQGTILNDD